MLLDILIQKIKNNKKLMQYITFNPRLNNIAVYILTLKLLLERGTYKLFLQYLYNTTLYYVFHIKKDVILHIHEYSIVMPNHMKPIDWVIEVLCDDFYEKIQHCKHVLDLWGYIGESALRLAKQNTHVTVYEAHPGNYKYLVKNCSAYTNITTHQAAVVWNDQSTLALYGWPFNMWASLQKTHNIHYESVVVPCKNIIDILRNEQFDAMKMDIEWGEFSCMDAIMQHGKDFFLHLKIWCIECHISWDSSRAEKTQQLIIRLKNQQYSVSCIDAVTSKYISIGNASNCDIVLIVFNSLYKTHA